MAEKKNGNIRMCLNLNVPKENMLSNFKWLILQSTPPTIS